MKTTAPRRPKAVGRKATGPSWTFKKTDSGMILVTLNGGGRLVDMWMYPAEFEALKKACSFDIWADEQR
jgi:hypothetical protein